MNTDDMFEPIKTAIKKLEEALYEHGRLVSELKAAQVKASLFEGDIRRVLASVTCPCCGVPPSSMPSEHTD